MSQFDVTFEESTAFDVEFAEDVNEFTTDMTTVVEVFPNAYEGQYEITPTTELQTLSTKRLVMIDNLTINPIPSNYGEIIWDGSTLTVR